MALFGSGRVPFFFFSTPRPLALEADLELALGILTDEVGFGFALDLDVVSRLDGFAMG